MLHVTPLQHRLPREPHTEQIPEKHPKPALQVSPLQHDCPLAPHTRHTPAWHP